VCQPIRFVMPALRGGADVVTKKLLTGTLNALGERNLS
jgi:hypothetical protein